MVTAAFLPMLIRSHQLLRPAINGTDRPELFEVRQIRQWE
jgi:hypothetical protein